MEYETRRTNTVVNVLAGLAVGALAMYIADPSQGRRRRALLQDKVSSVSHHTSKAMTQTLHHARNRLNGLQASATRLLSPRQAKPIDDHVLQARVRSRLGRVISNLHDVEVSAHEGIVTLGGQVAAHEQDRLAQLVAAIPGVEAVRHASHTRARGSLLNGRNTLWVAGAVGTGLLAWYGITRRAPLGLLGAAGLGLLAGGTGKRSRRLAAPIAGQAVEIEKTIEISATPEAVFDIWSRYENFPYFLSHVVEVRDLGHNRSHWIMQGHGGAEVEWNSLLTVSERPAKLAWQSESDASVMHHGTVLLTPTEMGTRVTVKLTWSPPAGSSDEQVAVLLGEDPQCTLDEDLLRMKQFIERGLPVRETLSGSAEAGAILH